MDNNNDTMISQCVIDGLEYVNTLQSYIPLFLEESNNIKYIQTISMNMRRKLPEPTRYIVYEILNRLTGFALEASSAFNEERTTTLPKPKTHIDYTLRIIWSQMNKTIDYQHIDKSNWKPVTWNPYEDIYYTFLQLTDYIGLKHFNIKHENNQKQQKQRKPSLSSSSSKYRKKIK